MHPFTGLLKNPLESLMLPNTVQPGRTCPVEVHQGVRAAAEAVSPTMNVLASILLQVSPDDAKPDKCGMW